MHLDAALVACPVDERLGESSSDARSACVATHIHASQHAEGHQLTRRTRLCRESSDVADDCSIASSNQNHRVVADHVDAGIEKMREELSQRLPPGVSPRCRREGRRDHLPRLGRRSATVWPVGTKRVGEVSPRETVRMLDGVPLFAGLTKRQLVAVAKLVDHVSFDPGAVLVKELDVGRRLIIIRTGTAEVRRQVFVAPDDLATGVGAESSRRVATVGPGDVVGELSLIDGRPTSASVVADTELETLVLYATRFKKLLGSMPQLYPRLLVGLAARVRALDHRGDAIG